MNPLLILGLLLFTGTHLVLSLAPTPVATARRSLGEGPVKGIVALLSAAGLVLIVIGWRASTPQWLYTLPAPVSMLALLLIAAGVYLFVVSNRPSAIKRVLRHPQLTGLLLWCVGHLLLNGDSRSLLLFGWLGIWAIHEILLINRRDRDWQAPAAPPLATDLITATIAAVVIAVLIGAHPWLAGVPAIHGL